jgi:hypothetical protein
LQPLEGRPIARNPLSLAELYFSGLDGDKWKNQKEAVAALGHLRPSVSRQDLSRAVGVSKLPPPVLSVEAAQADEMIAAGQDLAPIIQMVLSMLRARKVRCSS